MCRVLNISEFWVFLNFRKYDRVLNMHQDAIMEEFWIFQYSEYARLLHMPALHRVLSMTEYGQIIPYGRVLNIPGRRFTGF